MCYVGPVPWSDAQIDGFVLAAIACEDPGAEHAVEGLARRVRSAVSERARSLACDTPDARRAWVRRTLSRRLGRVAG